MTWRHLGLVGLLGLLMAATPAPPADQGIELTYLNQTHTDMDFDLAPIQEGMLSIQLSSPSHRLHEPQNTEGAGAAAEISAKLGCSAASTSGGTDGA